MASWVSQHDAAGIKVGFGKRGSAALGVDAGRDMRFVTALRRELGPDKFIMIDIGAAIHWDVRTAITRTMAFEESDIAWIEEPLGADDPRGYAELRSRLTTKIAYGEREWTPRGVQRIVDTGMVDVVGIDPGRCEGITGWRAAAVHGKAAGREVNAHAWSSAIVTAASLALSFAAPHCHQIEIKPLPNPMQHELTSTPITASAGGFAPPTRPGLGVEIEEAVLNRYRLGACPMEQRATGEPDQDICLDADDLRLLAALATGLPTHAVARTLSTISRTVQRRTRDLCDRIGVHTAVEAVAWAARRQLI